MSKVADEDGPVLRWVGILLDPLCNHLAQCRVFGKPFASDTADGVPSDLDGPWALFKPGFRQRDHVWRLAEANSMLECQFPLVVILLAVVLGG